jgi:hypothetical protein
MGSPDVARDVEQWPAMWAVAFGDADNARLIYLAAGGLALLGVLLAWATWRWWRSTKPEPAVLGPLEMMGERKWRRADAHHRARLLDEARPPGAERQVVQPQLEDLKDDAEPMSEPDDFGDLRDEPAAQPAE